MKIRHVFIASVILAVFTSASFGVRECPSQLWNHLHPIGASSFSWGLELKGFSYFTSEDSYPFWAGSLALAYEKGSHYAELEAVFKPRPATPCERGEDLFPLQIRRLNWEFQLNPKFTVRAGRQVFAVGSGLILDDFFDGIQLQWGKKNVLTLGSGVYSLTVAREALGCQKCFFFNYRSCWKELWQQSWGETGIVFANYAFRLNRIPVDITVIQTFSRTSHLNSTLASVHLRPRVFKNWHTVLEFIYQVQGREHRSSAAFYMEIFRSFSLGRAGSLRPRLHFVWGDMFSGEPVRPVFGNIYLGFRQHYSLLQGKIIGTELKWHPPFIRRTALTVGYFANIYRGVDSDELDVAVQYNLNRTKKIKLLAVYSLWSGFPLTSQFSIQLRIVI